MVVVGRGGGSKEGEGGRRIDSVTRMLIHSVCLFHCAGYRDTGTESQLSKVGSTRVACGIRTCCLWDPHVLPVGSARVACGNRT